jgi:hypothetical protein
MTEEGKTVPQLSDKKWVMNLSFILDKTAYFCKNHKLARDNDFSYISFYWSEAKIFHSSISEIRTCTTVCAINVRVCMGHIHLLRNHGSFRSQIVSVFLVITLSRPELMKLKVQGAPQVPKGK